MTRLRIGTRGSALARAQTALVVDALRQVHPALEVEVIVIRTSGDRLRGVPTADGDPGSIKALFTKEIEEALRRGAIDLAVHSLKDLPVLETPGLRLGAIPARGDPRDAVVTRDGRPLSDLLPGARVGTGSGRRDVLVREVRPDLRIVPLRGNVDTRLRRLGEGAVEALIVAAAGLIRLGRAGVIAEFLPPDRFVPAAGQGALAVQVRAEDSLTGEIAAGLDHPATRQAVEAERRFAAAVGGDCRLPVGAYAVVAGERLSLIGMVCRERPARVAVEGPIEDGPVLAAAAADAALAAVAGAALAPRGETAR